MEKRQGFVAGIVKFSLWIYSAFTFFTLIYLVYNSFRGKRDFLSNTLGKPAELSFDNYIKVIVQDQFFRYFFNSVFILVCGLVVLIVVSSLTAYGIARYRFPAKKAVRIFFLIGMMFPVQLGIVPIFLLMKNLGLVNNMLSVILITSAGISMPVFMLTNYFGRLPKAIYEAAIVDGAGEWKTFFSIMFPMARPVVMAVCITNSVAIWNQFFLPLIFLQSDTYKTVPLLVTKFTKNLLMNVDSALAVSVLATVPILLLFIIFANNIIDGVTAGAVKG